jgi:SRSO17 transposase
MLGLLAPLERKNGRRLADFADEARPDGMQRLLTRAKWSADAVRDEVQDYVSEGFGDDSATFVLTEATFEKRGHAAVGLGSHYDPVTGRFVKSQLGIFLVYASPGRPPVLADRRLFLGAQEASKAALASEMLTLARDRLPFRWLVGSHVFGTDSGLRARLEEAGLPYLFSVPSSLRSLTGQDRATVASHMSDLSTSHRDPWYRQPGDNRTVEIFADEWAKFPLPGATPSAAGTGQRERCLLVRRDRRTRSLACYVCFGPVDAPLPQLAIAATTEAAGQVAVHTARTWAGLDQYQGRSEQAWYRHVTLAMLAYACLATTVAREQPVLLSEATERSRSDDTPQSRAVPAVS